jgi:hypothetical protein
MGVFDVPAPLFAWLDGLMNAFAPPTARLVLWGAIGAAVSMGLYWLLSPQQRIAQTKARAQEARRTLDTYEGDFSGAWPHMREMLRLSLKQVGIVLWPAVAASLPLLCLLVWVNTAYGHYFPARDSNVEIRTFPEQLQARWIPNGQIAQGPASKTQTPSIELRDNRGEVVRTVPMPVPVPTVHKRQWWNVLFANPVGYLPIDAHIDRIEIDLPSKEFLPFGPSWLRSWEFLFFTVLIVASVAIKVAFRIK